MVRESDRTLTLGEIILTVHLINTVRYFNNKYIARYFRY